MSDISIVLVGAVIVLFFAGMLMLVFFPPHRRPIPPDPGDWRGETLWAGEEVRRSTYAVLEIDGRWAAGFLYVTNFRLIWVERPSAIGLLEIESQDKRSLTIRLTRIKSVTQTHWLTEPRLRVIADQAEYVFIFATYLTPLLVTGDKKESGRWLRALQELMPAAAPEG